MNVKDHQQNNVEMKIYKYITTTTDNFESDKVVFCIIMNPSSVKSMWKITQLRLRSMIKSSMLFTSDPFNFLNVTQVSNVDHISFIRWNVLLLSSPINKLRTVYVGTVMTSCYPGSTSTRGSWFQTNQPEYESDDRAGDPVTPVCITNEKDTALQRQIWSTFVTGLWCSKTEIKNGTGILVLVRVLWDRISKIYWQFWHSLLKNTLRRKQLQ